MLVDLGPPALIALVAFLVAVFMTIPVRPFVDVRLEDTDLVPLAAAGVIAGLAGRRLAGLAGLLLGVAAAIALQLWVLSSWATYGRESLAAISGSPNVLPATDLVADRPTGEWLVGVGGLLVLAVGVMAIGYLVGVTLFRQRVAPGWPALVVGAAAGLGIVVILVAAAGTPLVLPDATPRLLATADGDGAVVVDAAPDRPGIHLATLERTGVATADAYLCGPLSEATLANIREGSVADADLGCVNAIRERPSSAWLVDLGPGRYAWLILGPGPASSAGEARSTVEEDTLFTVPDTALLAVPPRTGGEPALGLAAGAACVVAGLAAAGSVLRVTTRGRVPGRPVGAAAAAWVAGVVFALVIGQLTLVAASLAANPF
jgi:hypothetical protein